MHFCAGLRRAGKIREYGLQLLAEEGVAVREDGESLAQYNQFMQNLQLLGFRPEIGVHLINRVLVNVVIIDCPRYQFDVQVSVVLLFKLRDAWLEDEVAAKESAGPVLEAVAANLEVEAEQLLPAWQPGELGSLGSEGEQWGSGEPGPAAITSLAR